MESCSFAEIETAFDEAVTSIAASQGVDPVCSLSSWIVPAADAFAAPAEKLVWNAPQGFVTLLRHDTPNGSVLSSFDPVWGFATPLIGSDPDALVEVFAPVLEGLDFHVATISGLDPAGPLFDAVQRLGPAGYTDTADRCIVDLGDGFDAWLSRRSSRFRRSLRTAASGGETNGLTIESSAPSPDEVAGVFLRILDIEATSWKTDAGSGLIGTQLGRFTRAMADRFAHRGGLRVQFAQRDGQDVGYVIGARHRDRYRGFQHSFNKDHPGLSIGKFLQFHTIRELAEEGVELYDMGMHMGYKVSYADRIESTVTAVIAGTGPPQSE